MKTEIVTTREQLWAIAGEWDRVARLDRRDGFFRTPAWCLAWLDHIRPDAEPFVVIARTAAGEIAGLAPLCRTSFRDHAFGLTVLSPLGREVVSGDFLDYAAVPELRSEALAAIVSSIWESRSSWELLLAGEASEGGDLQNALEALAARERLPLHAQEQRVCPYIELPATFEDYLRSVSQKMRYEIRRDSRELLERGGASIDVWTEPADVCAHLDQMIALHLAHWQHLGQPGTMGRPGFREFLRSVFSNPPAESSTRLYILSHGGKPAAALLAFCFGENMMFYQTGWDPHSAVARMSPGMVLVARSIRDAIEGGYRYFDFLRGDETYKTRLTKTSRITVTLLLGRSFLAKEYLRALRLKDSVKRMLSNNASPEAAAQSAPAAAK